MIALPEDLQYIQYLEEVVVGLLFERRNFDGGINDAYSVALGQVDGEIHVASPVAIEATMKRTRAARGMPMLLPPPILNLQDCKLASPRRPPLVQSAAVGEPVCRQCGTLLLPEGHCGNTHCAFADHAQTCPMGVTTGDWQKDFGTPGRKCNCRKKVVSNGEGS